MPTESMDPTSTHAAVIESLSACTATVPVYAMPPPGPEPVTSRAPRRGKAPPMDAFTGENPEVRFEDWLPTLERVAISSKNQTLSLSLQEWCRV